MLKSPEPVGNCHPGRRFCSTLWLDVGLLKCRWRSLHKNPVAWPNRRTARARCDRLAVSLLDATIRTRRSQTSHRQERQHREMSVVVMHHRVRCSRRKPNVISMWHRVLPPVGHSQCERNPTRNRRLDLFPCHGDMLPQNSSAGKCPMPSNSWLTTN